MKKENREVIETPRAAEEKEDYLPNKEYRKLNKKERKVFVEKLELEMKDAARHLQFERAAELRDLIMELKAEG